MASSGPRRSREGSARPDLERPTGADANRVCPRRGWSDDQVGRSALGVDHQVAGAGRVDRDARARRGREGDLLEVAPLGRGRGASSSIGGAAQPPRSRAAAAAAVAAAAQAAQPEGREESFSLESSGPPAFAAVVKLTPDLIDEIRRAEEAGSGARIMFNSNINAAENVSSLSPSVVLVLLL